ncbi:MAG: cyclic nucleotide-binding domain-containing protein [Acidimicrobiia bacterium]
MDEARLKSVPLFTGLSKHELRELARWADEVDVPAGTHLVREGEFAHEFFAIEEGTADVLHDDRTLANLGPGDFFGEIALELDIRRTASVVAISPMRLIVMFQREFRAMEHEMPEVAVQIRAAIEKRLPGSAG